MSAGCTLLSFQRPLRLRTTGLVALHARARHQALPRGTKEYSAVARLCLVTGAEPPEAPLADLQHAAVERCWSQIQRIGRDRLAVELGASLLDQATRLAGADLEGTGHQLRQVDLAAVVAQVGRQVELLDLVGRLAL